MNILMIEIRKTMQMIKAEFPEWEKNITDLPVHTVWTMLMDDYLAGLYDHWPTRDDAAEVLRFAREAV